ncbi:MAG: hypothetical protein QG629_28 [Patescibacteria group bacterium]|nr:hypothetical protein [Patescibacteria group bacterium]
MGELLGVQITFDEAHELRKNVYQNLFSGADTRIRPPETLPEETESMEYLLFSGSKNRQAPDSSSYFEESIFVGGLVRQASDGGWKLIVTRNRMRRTETLDENRFRTILRIICGPDDVIEASRTVKITHSLAVDPAKGLIDEISEPKYRRVGFTIPITSDDCSNLSATLQEHSRLSTT